MSLSTIGAASAGGGPAKIRKTAKADEIAFALGASDLGLVLVARSNTGVCAILIGSDAETLERDLAARFRRSTPIRSDAKLQDDLRSVIRFIESPAEGLELRLDVRGTPFQRRVWEALLGIPAGTTSTYAEVARRIGAPVSVRAVASACAANAIALAIPCHRVLGSDGGLSGYRWGVERKQALLDREALA